MIRTGGRKITAAATAVRKKLAGMNETGHTPAHVIALTWAVPDNQRI